MCLLSHLRIFGSTNLQEVSLTGVEEAHLKHKDTVDQPKGVKAHFRMDDSGILTLDKVSFGCLWRSVKKKN